MPRANRYFIHGNIWHLTHRCHEKDFLLKFGRERRRWIHWLFQAKKRYRIKVLNYIATCNHIHLLVMDDSKGDIPRFMQLLQSRTAQEYNQLKCRKGAFWEDRYHATAIESDDHLMQCMMYISMNMVRAGVIQHPIQWKDSGFYEIQNPRKRYTIIDYPSLLKSLNINSINQLQLIQNEWITDKTRKHFLERDGKWTEAIAVGNPPFLEEVKQQLDVKARARSIHKSGEDYILADTEIPYNNIFDTKNDSSSIK